MDTIDKEQLAKTIGCRLKELRKAVTEEGQGGIAQQIGVTKQAVNSYENGRRIPDLPVLIALAKRYECSMDYLLGLSDKISSSESEDAEKTEMDGLLDALDGLADGEGDYLLGMFAGTLNSLAVHKVNPQRENFICYICELFEQFAIYFDISGQTAELLSKKADEKTLTPEDVAVALARVNSFDGMERTVDDIRKAGVEAILSFSPKSRRVLNDKVKRKKYSVPRHLDTDRTKQEVNGNTDELKVQRSCDMDEEE